MKMNIFNLIRNIYKHHTANILNEKLSFPAKMKNEQGWLLSPLLFKIILEVLANTIKTRKGKSIHTGKVEIKLSLFTNDMVI